MPKAINRGRTPIVCSDCSEASRNARWKRRYYTSGRKRYRSPRVFSCPGCGFKMDLVSARPLIVQPYVEGKEEEEEG